MPSFYADLNYYNTKRSVDIALFNHLSNLTLRDDLTRIIYASNDYALRKRSDKNKGKLEFPFVNIRATDNNEGLRPWWNAVLYGGGAFIPDIDAKLQIKPMFLKYEGTYWCHRDDEKDYAFHQMSWDSDNKTILRGEVELDSQTVDLPVLLGYETLDYDPKYNETDWLKENKIHSISFNLSVKTFSMIYNGDIFIPETVLFNFAENYGQEVIDYDTTLTWLLDHVLEEKTEQ